MIRPLGGVLLSGLGVLTVLLAVLELLFQYTYIGPVPLPLGTVLILGTMPWMVRAAVEAWPTPAVAGGVPGLWFVTTAVFGVFGPGGDTLIVAAWQTLLLLGTGVLVGLFCFRRAVEEIARSDRGDRPSRPTDPRIGNAGRPQ